MGYKRPDERETMCGQGSLKKGVKKKVCQTWRGGEWGSGATKTSETVVGESLPLSRWGFPFALAGVWGGRGFGGKGLGK